MYVVRGKVREVKVEPERETTWATKLCIRVVNFRNR